jgi:apoptosis-inducing factor 2
VRVEGANDGRGGAVHLAGGQKISYNVLVLAPGSLWEGPLNLPPTKAEIDSHLKTWRRKFQDAKSVMLAGGGPVGIGE